MGKKGGTEKDRVKCKRHSDVDGKRRKGEIEESVRMNVSGDERATQ